MKNLIVFDCENVDIKKHKELIEKIENHNILLFFGFTQIIKNIPNNKNLEIIQANGKGSNYLDFQLVTEIAIRSQKTKIEKIYIISNDNGFDAAVEQFKRYNINVKRLSEENLKENPFSKEEIIIEKIVINQEDINNKNDNNKEEEIDPNVVFQNTINKIKKTKQKTAQQGYMLMQNLYKKHGLNEFTNSELDKSLNNILGTAKAPLMKNIITQTKVISGPQNKKHINVENLEKFVNSIKKKS